MYNILLIEDDRPLNKAISVYFKKEKFCVKCFLDIVNHTVGV